MESNKQKKFDWICSESIKILKIIYIDPTVCQGRCFNKMIYLSFPEAKFKEFKLWLKFETRLKYGWFYLKLYSMFQDLSRRSNETGFRRI